MSFVIADRVRETTTTTGTGAVTLAGAYTSFQSFASAIGNGNNTYYTIASPTTGDWEVGIGTYTSGTNTLSRDTVLASSNSGSLVNLGAGSKDVFVTQPAERSLLVQNGGSGLFSGNSAFTANGVVYASSTSALTTGSALTFDGSKLLVSSSGEQLKLLSSGDFTSTGTGYIRWYDSGGAKGYIGYAGTANQFDLQTGAGINLNFNAVGGTTTFAVSNSEQMRLTSTGLGIGTSSPGAKLDVNGDIHITYTGTGNTGLTISRSGGTAVNWFNYTPSGSTDLRWFSGADLMTLNSSGNLGLGVTPSAWSGSGVKALDIGTAASLAGSGSDVGLVANAYYNGSNWIYKTSSLSARYQILVGTGSHAWFTAPSGTAGSAISFNQAMTLNASGQLLLGQTTPSNTTYGSYQYPTGQLAIITQSGNSQCLFLNRQDDTGNAILFRQSNNDVGSVSVTASTTAYNTSSDYRLKHDIAPMTGALAKVGLLKPCTYKWNADGSDGEGFIAHELAEVCPHAVTGAKDAVDAEGKPIYQGIDTSFLVATLTAAIQELKAEFDAYKASHP
jgi:Chaperone of endosialidase